MRSFTFFVSPPFSRFLLLLLLLILCILHPISAATNSSSSYAPAENILLNCGSSLDAPDSNGRNWTGDANSRYALSSQNSATAEASSQDPSLPSSVPYMSARIFHNNFTYAFPVGSPRFWVRLYFYPSSYSNLSASDGFFSVNSGPYTLLHNFSASLTAQAQSYAYLIREFSLNSTDGFLNLTFTPSPSYPNAYAFVNGIEIVSMPDLLFNSVRLVGRTQMYPVQSNTAIEKIFRLNVGGPFISPVQDSGLYRTWDEDSPYIYGAGFGVSYAADPNIRMKYPGKQPAYIAPFDVYDTARSMGPNPSVNLNFNLTWIMPVDPGFYYLVRFHFCEMQAAVIKAPNQRVFTIFINNQTADDEADVIAWAGSNGVTVYKDYVIYVNKQSSSPDLWVALHPSTKFKPQWYDAILNGLEIFKINDSSGNLAGPNPVPPPNPPASSQNQANTSPSKGSTSRIPIIAGTVGGMVAVPVITFIIFSLVCRRKHKESGSSDGPSGWLPLSLDGNSHTANSESSAAFGKTTTGSYASSLPSNLCRHFSFAKIKSATNNVDESLLLGVGGFGKVYKGDIDGGTKVSHQAWKPTF